MTRIVPFLALAMASPAFAAGPYTVCVQVDVQTTDSGLDANGIVEDFWVGANTRSGYRVTARGVRIKVTRPANGQQQEWSEVIDTDPETGCATFNMPTHGPADIRVYAYATDNSGNMVRIHTNGIETSDWYPNPTLSTVWKAQPIVPLKTATYVIDGVADDRWTTFAVAAFSLYRFHVGNEDTSMHIGFSSTCGNSGSTHDMAENWIVPYEAHHIRIGKCPGSQSDTRQKGTISHEMGHATLRLYYGRDGDEQPRDQEFFPPLTLPDINDPMNQDCWNVGSYDMTSLEYNSQTFKEASADFVAARVWNLPDPRGTYPYRRRGYDLETWDAWSGTFAEGGYRENWCDYSTWYDPEVAWWQGGVTTKGDWLRLLWDWHTMDACDGPVSRQDVMDVYAAVRENNVDQVFLLTDQNYDNAQEYAILYSVPSIDQCQWIAYQFLADYNGTQGPY